MTLSVAGFALKDQTHHILYSSHRSLLHPVDNQMQHPRGLYDTAWLENGCPPGLYNPETKVDDSAWTFTTSYAIAATGITLAILLIATSSTSHSASTPSMSSSSSARARRKFSREEKRKIKIRQREKLRENKISSDLSQPQNSQSSSVPRQNNYHSSHGTAAPGEESIKSWRSYEESIMSVYVEDGAISTNPKSSGDKDIATNPGDDEKEKHVENTPPPRTPRTTNVSLANAPHETSPTPSTAANSVHDSDSSTLPTVEDQQSNVFEDFYMTLLVCYFVFQSISFLVAGFGHMTGQSFSGKLPSHIIHGTAAFAASSLIATAATEYSWLLFPSNRNDRSFPAVPGTNTKNSVSPLQQEIESLGRGEEYEGAGLTIWDDTKNRNNAIRWTAVWLVYSFSAVVVFAILDSTLYTSIYMCCSHCCVFLTALFRVCFCDKRQFLLLYILDSIAMLIYTTGLVMRLSLDGPCGYDGYQDGCFSDCPLPSPAILGHNAIFHLCVLASFFLYGCSKMVQMQPTREKHTFFLRDSAHMDPDHTPSPSPLDQISARWWASGAAAAVLMQDHTIEV